MLGVEIGVKVFVRVVGIFILFFFWIFASFWDKQSKLDILNSFLDDCPCSLRKSEMYLDRSVQVFFRVDLLQTDFFVTVYLTCA